MDALSLGLIVAAALVHATWNLLAKKASGGPIFVFFYSGATAVIYLPVIFFVDIFPSGVNPVYVLMAFGASAIPEVIGRRTAGSSRPAAFSIPSRWLGPNRLCW